MATAKIIYYLKRKKKRTPAPAAPRLSNLKVKSRNFQLSATDIAKARNSGAAPM